MANQNGASVVGYVRVSTDEQARGGVSLAVQTEKVRQFADLHDLRMVEVVVDPGASAKSLDRPGLRRVLAMLDSGEARGVVVTKLDRLTRSVADLARLIDGYFGEKAGKDLFSVGDSIDTRTAAGRLVLNVLMSVSQWERVVTYKRTRSERISGRIPYGCRLAGDGKTLEPEVEELAVVARMRAWTAEGWSPNRVARELNASAVPTRAGGRVGAVVRRLHPQPADLARLDGRPGDGRLNRETRPMKRRKALPFSARLRELIHERGLTAYAVAKASGVNASVVARFLDGERGLTTATLDPILDALGLDLAAGPGGLRGEPGGKPARPRVKAAGPPGAAP